MDFQSSEIAGCEHHDILALNVDGFCLAVGSREACLALLEINDEADAEPSEAQNIRRIAA